MEKIYFKLHIYFYILNIDGRKILKILKILKRDGEKDILNYIYILNHYILNYICYAQDLYYILQYNDNDL